MTPPSDTKSILHRRGQLRSPSHLRIIIKLKDLAYFNIFLIISTLSNFSQGKSTSGRPK